MVVGTDLERKIINQIVLIEYERSELGFPKLFLQDRIQRNEIQRIKSFVSAIFSRRMQSSDCSQN